MEITDETKKQKYYQALLAKDTAYSGIFYAGVTSTGVFCLSTCRARKPKEANVRFFSNVKSVLQHGFRPCKICKPTETQESVPSDVQKALQLLKKAEDHRVKDVDLRKNGIQPEKVRRWFNSNYGITFQAYQRMIRINQAYFDLKSKKFTVSDLAYQSGYESLSGFNYTFKKYLGSSPTQSEKSIILIKRLQTPLGPMYCCATANGVCLLEFTDRRMLETEFEDLQKRLNAVILVGSNEHIDQAETELQQYFAGELQQFSVALETPTTPFRQTVWEKLMTIPFGETTTYKKQAEKLGNTKAVRAVASANGHNRVAIIIPCHRVIGSDGSLTGYAGGLERKRWLLQHEGAVDQADQLKLF